MMNLKQCIKNFILQFSQNKLERMNLCASTLPDDFDLFDSGVFDSLRFIELLESVERHFRIELDLDGHDPGEFMGLTGLVNVVAQSVSPGYA